MRPETSSFQVVSRTFSVCGQVSTLGAPRGYPVTRHVCRSGTSAIWVSLRSTLQVVDAALIYTVRVQGCAGL